MKRLGLIGYGAIGAELHQALELQHQGEVQVVAIWTRSQASHTPTVPADLHVMSLAALQAKRPDLVVEAASAAFVRECGAPILECADFMPLSLTALADEALLKRLLSAARANNHRLFVPHGAVVGADALLESRAQWQSVSIEFRKPADSIDAGDAAAGHHAEAAPAVLFEGTVRDIAHRYPRNVNAMVACALLTTGLDACRARLIADPSLQHAELRILALGKDGSELQITRRQPMVGVSGTEMARSLLGSVRRACELSETLHFV
jgi:aspartate dehydrogenase